MLTKIAVSGFKVIQDSPLLSLGPFTVLIGRNGSGKSSLIEALEWLGRAVHDGAEAAAEPFPAFASVVNCWSAPREIAMRVFFDPDDVSVGEEVDYQVKVGVHPHGELPYIVSETLTAYNRGIGVELIRQEGQSRSRRAGSIDPPKSTVSRRVHDRRDLGLGMSKDPVPDELWAPTTDPDRLAITDCDPTAVRGGWLLRGVLETAVFLRLSPRSIAGFSPARSRPSPRLLDDQGVRLAALLADFDQEGVGILAEKLAHILQGADHLSAHVPQSPADRRYFTMMEKRRPDDTCVEIPAWVLSEGVRRITAILAVLLHSDPPALLCIEEIENGLDPWTLRYVLDELAGAAARGTQVILTTHSPYFLNLVPLECIVFCDRQEDGAHFMPLSSRRDLDAIAERMGAGDLYSNRYLQETRSQEEC